MQPRSTLRYSLLSAVLLTLTIAGCGGSGPDAANADAAAAQANADAFAAQQQAWRDERKAGLIKPDGWTSLIGLHWIGPGGHYLGSDADNGMRLGMGPKHLGMIDLRGGRLRFVPESGLALTLDGQPLAGPVFLNTDEAVAGPSVLGFDEGKGLVTVIKRGDRYALRVKHADAATRTGFKGIDYWPAKEDWKITGKFVPHPPGRTIEVANIVGTTDKVPNPGAVEFERDGKSYRIEALDEGDGELFLVFADRTNGHGSYGAGRFLDATRPDPQGRVTLDFNRTYNPPCAFTAFATCPLPPPENRLDLLVDAGEKAYKAAN
ncbi:DUF1684 domain-containing protein [Montanilutibacter psychrotolerans]|uniref:DUF1684 domain-containing protein n=1 Tax=Montanilutibacter psychrotolerans TaxID=1327343 RepID=UPI00168106BE|nr:DUF1684 domain-containing protein [Lysobacter psychrotolerans]